MKKPQNKPFTARPSPVHFFPTTVLLGEQDVGKSSASYLPDSATMTLTEIE